MAYLHGMPLSMRLAGGDELWWIEPQPREGPRSALMRKRPAAAAGIILPEPWDIRGRVIVHAGRPWAAAGTAFGAPLQTRREDVHAVAVGAPGNGAGTQNGTS